MTATSAAIVSQLKPLVMPVELVDRLRAIVWPGLAVLTAQTPAVLAMLAEVDPSNDTMVCAVADNQHTGVETLAKLARSRYKYVRITVGRNPRTPVDALEHLAMAKSADVRASVAYNRALPASLARQLAADPIWAVRYELAANPNVAASLLEPDEYSSMVGVLAVKLVKSCMYTNAQLVKLTRHPDERVRALAQRRINEEDTAERTPRWSSVIETRESLRERLSEMSLDDAFEQPHLVEILTPVPSDVADIAVALAPTWTQTLPALLQAAYAAT